MATTLGQCNSEIATPTFLILPLHVRVGSCAQTRRRCRIWLLLFDRVLKRVEAVWVCSCAQVRRRCIVWLLLFDRLEGLSRLLGFDTTKRLLLDEVIVTQPLTYSCPSKRYIARNLPACFHGAQTKTDPRRIEMLKGGDRAICKEIPTNP